MSRVNGWAIDDRPDPKRQPACACFLTAIARRTSGQKGNISQVLAEYAQHAKGVTDLDF
jgi:hypothetical protein